MLKKILEHIKTFWFRFDPKLHIGRLCFRLISLTLLARARSLESLIEKQNWFLNQFDETPRISVIVSLLSLSEKAGLNLPPFAISCSWPPSLLFS
jgi:hypothetical protein